MNTISYRIILKDNTGSFAVDAIASTCNGVWRNAVQKFDGELDLAFVDVDPENSGYLESVLDSDDNVVSYAIRSE